MTPISIGITTRNRPASLLACLRSIAAVLGTGHDVLVFDDASERHAADHLAPLQGELPVRVLRDESGAGYIAGRNALVHHARHEHVLLLDDDAVLLDAGSIRAAVTVLEHDVSIAAVAFAQADLASVPWPQSMQPAPCGVPSRVASFIGFAHMVRRSVFMALNGYRASFVFFGEEKDFCRRLLAGGYGVVYLPDARIAHVQDPAGRDRQRHLRYLTRNDCLTTLYNDPVLLVLLTVPVKLWRYARAAVHLPNGDRGGLRWLLRELLAERARVQADRRAVSWKVVRQWRRLRAGLPYSLPTADAARSATRHGATRVQPEARA